MGFYCESVTIVIFLVGKLNFGQTNLFYRLMKFLRQVINN